MNTPLVSVIIPIKDRCNIIERALKSVTNQTYRNIEIIIVDDGSDDNLDQKIQELKKDIIFPLIYIKQKNTGPGIARSNGLKMSNGKYIQYLDSDDELLPDKIKSQVEVLEAHPDVVMVYGKSIQNWDEKKVHRKRHKKYEVDDLIQSALEKRKWHTSACLWNYGKIDDYWDNLRNGEDVLHDVTVGIKVGNKIMYKNEIVCNVNFKNNDPSHLSNYGNNKNQINQIVANASKLNYLCYERLLAAGLKKKEYIEPLAERYFYEALKFAKFNHVSDSVQMLKRGGKLTNNLIKKIEFSIALFIVSRLNNNFNLIKGLFKLHTKILPPKIHQYRTLRSFIVIFYLTQNLL